VAALVTERDPLTGPLPSRSPPVGRAVALAFRRLLPLLVLMHLIAYADRVNITFAETEISEDLALSATTFGLAAGIFFAPYVALEVPSNLVLHRVGARRWMGRIMITWGIVAAGTAFVWDGTSLILARILLGVGEAGFFPGVVYLISCWFPERDRARAMGVFMLGIVIAAVIGGPLSGGLLELDGVLGLEGWQWLFLGQGLPAVAVGAWVLRALPSSPAEAAWLGHEERVALERELAAESAARERRASFTLRGALTDRRILHCAAVYFTINFASYGAIFWFADILERIGDVEGIELGLLAAVPMALGSAGLVVIGRRSDRSGDRRRWVVIGMLLGAAGLGATALLPAEACVLTLGVCAFGLLGAVPAFWAMPTSLLNGRPAAGGVALINTIGVTGGIFGPVVVGAAKDADSLEAGLGALALVLFGGTALAARLPFVAREPGLELRTAVS
jgi:MFS transporter, ACS family, tartrate transporter